MNKTNETFRPGLWFLLADAHRAKLLQAEREDRFDCIESFEFDTERSARDTRESGFFRGSGRNMVSGERKTTAKRSGEVEFAREIARFLKDSLDHQRFERLAIFAPPEFLGILFHTLDKHVIDTVCVRSSKDYLGLPAKELAAQLRIKLQNLECFEEKVTEAERLPFEVQDELLILTPKVNLNVFELELAQNECSAIRHRLLREPRIRHVIVDCDASEYFCADATDFLVQLWETVRARGGGLTLCNLGKTELNLVEAFGLSKVWAIEKDLECALKNAQENRDYIVS